MHMAESVLGPTAALGGLFPVGKDFPGYRAAHKATALHFVLTKYFTFLYGTA